MNSPSTPECCVCGKPSDAVVCTGLGPMSDAYCQECANEGLQPWRTIVAVAWCIGAQSLEDCAPHFQRTIKASTAWMQAHLEPPKQKCQEDLWQAVRNTEAEFQGEQQ